MRSSPVMVVSLALGLTVLMGCPKRVDSQSELDPTAREKVAEAKRQADSGKSDEALKLLAQVPQDNQAVADVLFQVGEQKLAEKDWAAAKKSYGDLLAGYPLFDKADTARHHLALAQLELKDYRDALQTLTSLYPRIPEDQKPGVAAQLSRAAEGAKSWAEAVRWRSEAMKLARDEQGLKAEQARIFDLLETRMPFLEVARLAQELPTDSPLWQMVQFKLAKIYAHLRDRARMKETLDVYLAKAPQSAYAAEARAMLARLERHAQAKADTIGVAVPTKGKYKAMGESVLAGLQLALADSKVKLVVKNTVEVLPDGRELNQARTVISELAQDDQVLAIVGPVMTAEAVDAAAEAELQETPIVTLTRAEGITEQGAWVFRNMLTSSAQAKALADWAIRVKGLKTFAVLFPKIAYGTELTNLFWDEVEAKGGEFHGAESYDSDQTTFAGVIKRLVGRGEFLTQRDEYNARKREIIETIKDPYRQRKMLEGLVKNAEPVIDFEALFIPDYYKNIGLVAPALAVEDVITNACDKKDIEKIAKTQGKEPRDIKTVQLLGGNLWNFPELVERGGKFVQCSVFVDGFYAASDKKETHDFVAEFKKATGKEPGLLEAVGYDTAKVLRTIIENEAPVSRAAMREALLKVKDFPGATGRTTVGQDREFNKPLFMLTIDRDQIREMDYDSKS